MRLEFDVPKHKRLTLSHRNLDNIENVRALTGESRQKRKNELLARYVELRALIDFPTGIPGLRVNGISTLD